MGELESDEGLHEASWWRQLAAENGEHAYEEAEWLDEPVPEDMEEELVHHSALSEAAAQAVMRGRCGIDYSQRLCSGQVGRRLLGKVEAAWGSAGGGLEVQARRGRRAANSRGCSSRQQPLLGVDRGGAVHPRPGKPVVPEPPPGFEGSNSFAALAEEDSEDDSEVVPAESEEDPEEALTSEAEANVADTMLAELVEGWLLTSPAFGGSKRQAACEETEELVTWLATQATLHSGPAWKAAVARHLVNCEEALQCLRQPAPWRS